MAIIRKGDKVAEDKLKVRAAWERTKDTNYTAKDPSRIDVQANPKTGKTKATRFATTRTGILKKTRATGPVSGKSVAQRAKLDKTNKPFKESAKAKSGSGIIQSGKVVKGGNIALKSKLEDKDKK
jgi:hypothetical protein